MSQDFCGARMLCICSARMLCISSTFLTLSPVWHLKYESCVVYKYEIKRIARASCNSLEAEAWHVPEDMAREGVPRRGSD